MITVRAEARGLDQIVQELGASDKHVRAAINSTIRKVGAWARTQSARGLAKRLQMPQRVLRYRMRSLKLTQTGNGAEIKLWYGLNPVAIIHLNAKKRARGVGAMGGRFVPGGFIARRQVFARVGKARLPIEKQESEIEAEALAFLQSDFLDGSAFEAKFLSTFEHEIKWRMQTLA